MTLATVRSGKPAAPRAVSRWNPANAVTASRFLTLPLLWWAIDHGYRQYATLFIIICGVLDKLDGLFDAITDGVCYGIGMILVAAYGWAPIVPVVFIIGLGAVNALLRGVYIKRAARTVNYKSYAMERIVGYAVYLVGLATSDMEVRYVTSEDPDTGIEYVTDGDVDVNETKSR